MLGAGAIWSTQSCFCVPVSELADLQVTGSGAQNLKVDAANGPAVVLYEPYVFGHAYGNMKYLLGLLRHARGFEPSLVVPARTDFVEAVAGLGLRCTCLRAPDCLLSLGGVLMKAGLRLKAETAVALVRYNLSFARWLRREPAQIVQYQNLRGLLMTGLGARLAGRRVVWYIKGLIENPRLDRLAFALADRVIFQNDTNMRRRYPDLLARHAAKLRIVENGIDLEEIADAENRARAAGDPRLFGAARSVKLCYAGQLAPAKGVETLLRALAIVQREHAAPLLLVGDHGVDAYASYVDHLRGVARSCELRDIHFLGWRDDALEIVARSDVLVLPSLSEGVPRSILEAMALGKPVIASRVGGVAGVVEDGRTGFLVEPGDVGGLADRLRRVIVDPGLCVQMGRRAQEIASTRYSLHRNVDGLRAIYTEIVRGRW